MSALGDRHNFGKSVRYLDNNRLHKPRPVYLEWLFLGESDFRAEVDAAFAQRGAPSPFAPLPTLSIAAADPYREGEVERLELAELVGPLSLSEHEEVGSAVALAVWFGLGDLHRQNLLLGRSAPGGPLAIAPIDIECALEKIALPSDTLLLPGQVTDEFSGLRPYFAVVAETDVDGYASAAALVHGFCATMLIFKECEERIAQAFVRSVDLGKARVRVVPRDTRVYSRMSFKEAATGLFACELEQLLRGDIPYYFRHLGSHTLYYFTESGEKPSSIVNNRQGICYPGARLASGISLEPQTSPDTMRRAGALELLEYYQAFLGRGGMGTYKDTTVACEGNRVWVCGGGVGSQHV